MARLFEDGFDHYGSNEGNMLDGVYAHASDVTLSTAHPATGTRGVLIDGTDGVSEIGGLRKVLPGSARTKVGAAARFYFENLPTGNTSSIIFDFLSGSANRSQVAIYVDTNGRLAVYKDGNYNLNGEPGTQIALSDPAISTGQNNHIEVQVFSHATAGWVRIAVNEITVLEALNLDTLYDASGIVSIAQHQNFYGGAGINPGPFYMDDYYIYDFTGDSAVDTDFCPTVDGGGIGTNFIGELNVMWRVPVADTAEDDWVPSTGSDAYAMVDEVDPNDNDYIFANDVGDLTELALEDLPEDITYIRGLTVWGRLSKPDSGVARITLGMKSDTEVFDAPERPITVEPTYWWDQVNKDPNSDARWTRASYNAAWMRIVRTL